jgi:hypothetical protein
VNFREDYFEHPVKVKNPSDFKPGTKVPKLVKTPVWLVEIVMPKKLMADIQQGALELESGTVDLEDIDDAYETGADNDAMNQQDNIDDQQSQQPAAPAEPQL